MSTTQSLNLESELPPPAQAPAQPSNSARAAARRPALRHIRAIARYTLQEAWHARLLLWAGIASALVAAAALFVVEVAITDVGRMKAGLLGGPLRLMAAFATATLVASAIVRELNDKIVELMLSMAVARHEFFLGKLLGHVACAWILALIFALPVLPLGDAGSAAAWTGWAVWAISLALELSLISAVALLTVLTFGHLALALGATAAFYTMSRLLADIQLIARSGASADSLASQLADGLMGGIGLALPRLDLFTRTAWLVDGASFALLPALAGQVALYLALLAAVGLWDLYRREW